MLLDYEQLLLSDRRALAGLHDSKQMGIEDRERLYPCVLRAARRVAVTIRCVHGIDARGLHVTNIEALSRSLEVVAGDGAGCLVDGFRLPGCSVQHRAVIEGDGRSAAIAAASIVAKVTRDRCMRRAEHSYPGWGFAENVGYSTPGHREAIERIGISPLHRRSFQSVAYLQLGLEGVFDVLEGADPVLLEGDADGVEADRAVAG